MLTFKDICHLLNIEDVCAAGIAPFSDVALHSDRSGEGVLFWAIPNSKYTLKDLTELAWRTGSHVVLAYGNEPLIFRNPSNASQICLVRPFASDALNVLGKAFYPERPKFTCAVTGTNGKTSTVWWLSQLWQATERSWATLGTLGEMSSMGVLLVANKNTTADYLTLSCALHKSSQHNVECFAFEASSHGLHQKRIPEDAVDIGIWTSFSQDHLDYHRTMENYWKAKSELILFCKQHILVHESIPYFEDLKKLQSKALLLRYGKGIDTKLWAAYELCYKNGSSTEIKIRIDQYSWQGSLPWAWEFQCANFIAALSAFHLSGGDLERAFAALREGKLLSPPGRLEWVATTGSNADVYVDYAHTPDALYYALTALRALNPKKLGVVFGCGGERDHKKRKLMGEVAFQNADWIILTNDNPRSECPERILDDIQKGCQNAQRIPCRKSAIEFGIHQLECGDILLIAGKGHETVQWTSNGPITFQDKQCIQSIVVENML